MENKVQNITVVGAGQMGHQIAMLSALGGYTTNLVDVSQNALIQAEKKLKRHHEQMGGKRENSRR